MTISKSLRFEVLRRDGFACSYCGRKPPDVELHIDHVTPAALGGRDTAENLRTSCAECNTGKGSTPPDAEMVAQVAEDAERWAAAIERAGREMVAEDSAGMWLVDLWNSHAHPSAYLPVTANLAVADLQARGLPRETIEEMFWVSVGARHVWPANRFAYFMGACRRRLERVQERAAEIIEEDDT